jgi:hypothetical protein
MLLPVLGQPVLARPGRLTFGLRGIRRIARRGDLPLELLARLLSLLSLGMLLCAGHISLMVLRHALPPRDDRRSRRRTCVDHGQAPGQMTHAKGRHGR